MSRYQTVLLPLFGAVAVFLAFAFAQPFVGSLQHPGLSPTDPASHYSTGTLWDVVEHVAFGILVCGSFCFIISSSQLGAARGLRSALIGGVIGGVTIPLANNVSDNIGISLERSGGMGMSLVSPLVWCLLVPTTLAFSLAVSLGPTWQRLIRALVGSLVAFIGSVFCQYVVGFFLALKSAPSLLSGGAGGASLAQASSLASGVPTWFTMDLSIAVILGFCFAKVQQLVRSGSLRLIAGRNEFRDWPLDYTINRIGSGERTEIPLRGWTGVTNLNAQIVRQGRDFIVDSLGQGGVAVNGHPLNGHAYLRDGDQIQVGSASLVFNYGRGSARPIALHRGLDPAIQSTSQTATMAATSAVYQAPVVMPTGLRSAAGVIVPLASGALTVGREPNCGVAIPYESSVSRNHAEITVGPSGVVVRDLGSTNGTFVNGSQVSQADLKIGDVVSFGGATFNVL